MRKLQTLQKNKQKNSVSPMRKKKKNNQKRDSKRNPEKEESQIALTLLKAISKILCRDRNRGRKRGL